MSNLRREIVLGIEGLDEVIILPSVLFVKLLLDENKFVQSRIGAAVNAADELVFRRLPAGDVRENTPQRAAFSSGPRLFCRQADPGRRAQGLLRGRRPGEREARGLRHQHRKCDGRRHPRAHGRGAAPRPRERRRRAAARGAVSVIFNPILSRKTGRKRKKHCIFKHSYV